MKTLLSVLALSASLCAQSTTPGATRSTTREDSAEFLAAGLSVNPRASSAIAGTGLFARHLSRDAFAFTTLDALPDKRGGIETNFSVGVAEKVFEFRSIPVFVPAEIGLSYEGSHEGWDWSTGVLLAVKAGKHLYVFPTVRVEKSNVSEGTGVQPIIGVLFGWGQ